MTRSSVRLAALAVAYQALVYTAAAQTPLGNAFSYQGRLQDGGGLASGLYDMHFRLYDAAAGGTQLGPVICYNNLNVVDGLFTTTLDFGDQFSGQERFLEIAVRVDAGQNCANTSGFTLLSPRQKLAGAPNALFSLNADKLDGLNSTAFLQSVPVPLTLSGTNPTSHTIGGENAAATDNSYGVYGRSTAGSGVTYGVFGRTDSTNGVGAQGFASASTGQTIGVWGTTSSPDGRGVYGYATALGGTTTGVWGRTSSTSGRAVFGTAEAGSGVTYGGRFENDSTSGFGVFGRATAGSGDTFGLWGQSDSTSGFGVFGEQTAASGSTHGVYGRSASTGGRGVFGYASAATGTTHGGYFQSQSASGVGAFGYATATTGTTSGLFGQSDSASGRGVYGLASRSSGTTYGGYFESAGFIGYGVYGAATSTDFGTTYGGYFESACPNGRGVFASATANTSGTTYGVYARTNSTSGRGVYGWATAATDVTYGVFGKSDSAHGYGVYGQAGATAAGDTPFGVRGYCSTVTNGYAVYAAGDLGASGTKSFRIDHPSDPENKYLLHYAAESPEVINFYSGNVTLDDRGEASVEMPAYFAGINKDPRYNLTPVGAPMPNLHVAEKISAESLVRGEDAGPAVAPPTCSFRIAGGVPGGEVSWEVKAVRNDLRMRLHGAPVECAKSGPEQGRYQHPEYYGQPAEMGMDYAAERVHLSP